MPHPLLTDYDIYMKQRDAAQPSADDFHPAVSIVTVMLNSAATLERTIRSVQAQNFPSIEHVFVDGGSTDGTLDIVRRLARPWDYWISEKDRGISDAFNKGVALARGRSILILNADDWLSPDQIGQSVAALEKSGADFVFGDLIFYEGDNPQFRYVGDANYANVIARVCPAIGHPTVLAARDCFARIGLFDLSYRNAMDYDWLLRLHRAGGRGAYSANVLGHMTHAGVSNLEFRRTIDEVKRIAIAHGRNPRIAGLEARYRYLKTAISQPIKRRAAPLYRFIRRSINASYKPVSVNG